MPRPTFKYPTGPGTPAWNAFDRAVEARAEGKIKRYYNQRQYMIGLLRKHNESVESWTRALKESTQ